MLSNAPCRSIIMAVVWMVDLVKHLGLFRFRYQRVAEGRPQYLSPRLEFLAFLDDFLHDFSQTLAEGNRPVCFHYILPTWGG
jgi:hypothetical protein